MRFGMACTDIGGLKVDKKIVYTADEEEPDCGQCDNCDGGILDCAKFCGPEHGWYGYQRTEYLEDDK